MKDLKKQILYIDFDTILMPESIKNITVTHSDIPFEQDNHLLPSIPIDSLTQPGAVKAFKQLTRYYDTYIVSDFRAVHPSIWVGCFLWIKHLFGTKAVDRLIICSNKNMLKGDFLITGHRSRNTTWDGSLFKLGSKAYPDWASIVRYLMPHPKPTSYDHIEQILTLELPLRKDTYRHMITSKDQPEYEDIADFYSDIIKRKLEEIKAGKYGDLYQNGMYNPKAGWYEDTQHLTFDFKDFDVTVELTDACIDLEGEFNEVITYIECTVGCADDEVPDYIQALEFEGHCEYECFEETLDTLFREIGKCKKRYLKEECTSDEK